jgi:hypothetical protein
MVRCGDHKWSPGGAVCVHLADGSSSVWRSVAEVSREKGGGHGVGPEGEHDYLCPACAEKFPHLSADDLVLMCMHCVRTRRARSSVREAKYELVQALDPRPGRYAAADPGLLAGDHVKLGFRVGVRWRDTFGAEWMWALVTAVDGTWPAATYRGELCNRPVYSDPAVLRLGQPVEFRAGHIYAVVGDSPQRPEAERETPP